MDLWQKTWTSSAIAGTAPKAGTIAFHLPFLVENVRLCSGPGLRALNL